MNTYEIVAKMLDCEPEEIPDSLLERINAVRRLVQAVKPYGDLLSTQSIATVIEQWKRDTLT